MEKKILSLLFISLAIIIFNTIFLLSTSEFVIRNISNVYILFLLIGGSLIVFFSLFFIFKKEYFKIKRIKFEIVLLYSILTLFVCLIDRYTTIFLNNKQIEFSFFALLPTTIIISIILIPIVEELLFRSIVIEYLLDKKFNNNIIVLFSAITFSLSHEYDFHIVYVFGMGCIWSYSYLKHRNLIFSIYLHSLYN